MLIICLNLVIVAKFVIFFFFYFWWVSTIISPIKKNVDNFLKFALDRGPAALDRI